MLPNKPQSDSSRKPIKRIRLLKIGPGKSKSLFEEYFYGFAIAISLVVMILGKAGGLSGYDAIVIGLWVGGFMWAGWVFRRYRKEQASPARIGKSTQAVDKPQQFSAKPVSANFKPMVGPQWPLKPVSGAARNAQWRGRPAQESMKPVQTPGPAGQTPGAPGAPSNPGGKAFVYERPTLPDRKPKLPNNWAGQEDKKPKR
jgi:hypothetical protein